MAGLLAARVLADAFTEVLVVDRDKLTGVTSHRRGVPQGRHAHGLVARGQQILEEYFPGLTDEIRAAGVKPGDFSGDVRWYFNGVRLQAGRSGLLSVPGPRWVLESQVRQRVQAIDNVTFLEQYDIVGLETTPDRHGVTGVRVRQRAEHSAEEVLSSALVVDTTGRGSRTPKWLEEWGYQRPPEERMKIDLAYTTRHYRLNSDPFDSDILIAPAATPSFPRGAFFYPIPSDDGRVQLSLTGILGDHPPTDHDGFLAFVRSLPVPDIFEAIRDAEPLDDPVMHRFPASVRRHYERLTSFPDNYLVLGDAVCSFNPVYAQGMTVAAIETLTLRDHLRSGAVPSPREFFRDIAREIDAPWELAAGSDLGYPGVEGRRTFKIRMANAYVARLHRGAAHDAELTNAFIGVAGLVDKPQSLMRPRNLIRVLSKSWRQSPADQPLELPENPQRPGQQNKAA
jgi:2-polyprenyl-6-methoxyphenol hydroxylase-like FAD-dependent oxidoreductase